MDPPPPGVSPDLKDDSFGVGKLPRKSGSKYEFCGPDSMAGLRGPDRNEFCQPGVPLTPTGAGDVRLASDGNWPLGGVSVAGFPNDCSNGLGSKWKLLG